MEVIPSINVRTFDEVKERIKKVEPFVSWCHLDVTDGVFSTHETWRNPSDLLDLETSLNIEVHLMVSNPDKVIDDWLVGPVKRVIIHAEAVHPVRSPMPLASADASRRLASNGVKNFDLIREKCRDRGIELGIAVNPETPAEALEPYIGKADVFLFLTVPPGPSGSPMHENTVGKIASFRKSCPKCILEVDGGVYPHTYKNAISAGANILVAGAFIFDSKDIYSAINELRK